MFRVDKIDHSQALIAYEAAAYFQSLIDFYAFVNLWAVVLNNDDEDAVDKFRYDG